MTKEMTKEIALYCMKSISESERELCEGCQIYGQTGCDHCYEDALQYVIAMLEQEPCDDCISKKAVRDTIFAKCSGVGLDIDFAKVLLLQRAIKALPSVTPTQRWIPVSERLPKVGEEVLCQCRANIFEVLAFTPHGWYHDEMHCYMMDFVVAWQELPQPYEPQERKDKE